MRSLLVIISAALVPTAAHADCAMMGLVPKVLTPAGAVITEDGGVVVGGVNEARASLDNGDVAVQASWKFVVAKGTITPAIESLAPGLAVYRASADDLELKNGDTSLVTIRRTAPEQAKLAAPKLKSIKYDAPLSKRSIQRIEVLLDGDAPAGALALVLADAKGKPKSWGPLDGKVLYPYLKRDCLVLPNGTVPSKKGDKVTLFFVDANGRKSAFTKPVTIQ